MTQRLLRSTFAGGMSGALILALLSPLAAAPASAAVVPGNESDIGVYTDGQTDSMEIGDPVYTGVDEVAAALDHGMEFTAGNMHESIFEADLDAGGLDFYLDRVLGVSGTQGNTVLQTRGRTLYMRGASNANFTTMGFAGNAFAGGPNNLGTLYSVTTPGHTVSEVGAQRLNAPSHASTRYTIGETGVVADQVKLITYDNVALTTITFTNPGDAAVDLTVRAASPLATTPGEGEDELLGHRTLTSGSNNGLVDTPWSDITIGLRAPGFERDGANLEQEISVPAGGSVELSVVGVLYSDALPESVASFHEYAELEPAEARRTGVTEFHQRWAADVPYINVPDPAVEKAIVYRWWGERYNSLDANEPGYVYQYPTTIEGVNLYQNSIVLTQPMHLQDTKWLRTPYLPYGQVLNVGELSGSSAFLDSPGHTSWNNHYSQYLGTAGLEAYNVHGGGEEIAERFAYYFESDGTGQLEHYDGNGDHLIAYDTNYMPGNDADAITFGYPRVNTGAPGARTIERPESAYVWGAFDAASQLYEIAGADQARVSQTREAADLIREAILSTMWSEEMRMFLATTSHGATAARTANGADNPLTTAEETLIPAKESNLYDIYAEGLIPTEDWEDYVDGFRFLRYGDNFPIFPFYTANQYDRAKFGIGGSNNFSNINFTVQYRGVRSALRHYDPEHRYVTPEYAARLLDWMAWSIYPGGDLRVANQAEYYSSWNPATHSFNRNNPNHIMLGNMNYIYVEDMGGIQARSDALVELWPIDLGYDHFMVNNLRYHGADLTIVWDPDGEAYGLGSGYSLFIGGERVATANGLGRFVYDPAANEITESDDDIDVTVVADAGPEFRSAVDTPIEDERVVEYLKTAGIDLTESAPNLALGAELSAHVTAEGERPAPWRQFHTPGWSSSSMNHTPGAISELERPVTLAALTDGVTVNEPYWGNHGTTEAEGHVELNLGSPTALDNVKVFFVSDRQSGGYREPLRWSVQIPDGSGGWQALPDQYRWPEIPTAKFNEALFDTVTTDRVRVAFTNVPSHYTAISEVQVFNSGRDVPEVVNQPPVVTVTRDTSGDGNLSTRLVATATDDGRPDDGELAYGWEVVETPEGASVIFGNASALSTMITGTAEGEYTLRFWASDGELRTEQDITVELTPVAATAEFGASATITTSGSAGWENPQRVNEPTTPNSSAPGSGNGWGTWGQPNNGTSSSSAAWIQYSWDSPVLLASTEIYWYDDNGGTRMPRADTWTVEHSDDGEEWTAVELLDGSAYADALTRNDYNALKFEPVQATHLRIRITGVQGSGAGTGVLRWRAYGDTVEHVADPVIMRTVTGVVPTLPAELDVVYSSGARGSLPFHWQEITPAMVAETNVEPFSVYGTNSAYGLIAEARIYVRPEDSEGGISIQGAQSFEQTVHLGELPYLPTRVEVSYNDGSRDNQAIGVEWDFDSAVVETAGVYVITGDLVLPPYVSDAGTTSTTLTLTVLDEDGSEGLHVRFASVEPPLTGEDWAGASVTLTLTASGPEGSEPSIEVQVGDGEWIAYSEPLVLETEGEHIVNARAIDGEDVSETVTQRVRIDLTAPEVTGRIEPVLRQLTLDAEDAGSGLASMEYRIGEGEWTEYIAPVRLGSQATTVQLRATDAVGNVSQTESLEIADATGRNIAPEAEVSASYTSPWNNIDAVNDEQIPTGDNNETFWGAWSDDRPESQWLQYQWDEPMDVSEVAMMFYANEPVGSGTGLALPASWRLQYLDDDGEWQDVPQPDELGIEADVFNVVSFEPVITTALRATFMADTDGETYAGVGVREWVVRGMPADPGEPIYEPAIEVTPGTVHPGEAITVNGEGFAAGETVAMEVGLDEPLRISVQAGADGEVTASFTIPLATPAGTYAVGALGDVSQTAAGATVHVVVAEPGPVETSVTLEVSAASLVPGDTLVLTATVRPANAEGEVRFLADGDVIATVPSGDTAATTSVIAGEPGEYVYTARFVPLSADDHTESESDPVTVVVHEDDDAVASITLSVSEVTAGESLQVSGAGFGSEEEVSVVLLSDPVTLGAATTDASGIFSLEVTVPADTAAGEHTVVATGGESGLQAGAALRVLADDGGEPPTPEPTESPTPEPSQPPGTTPPGSDMPGTGVSGTALAGTAALVMLTAGLLLARATRVGGVRGIGMRD